MHNGHAKWFKAQYWSPWICCAYESLSCLDIETWRHDFWAHDSDNDMCVGYCTPIHNKLYQHIPHAS